MGGIISICDCSKEKPTPLLARISRMRHDSQKQNLTTKKLLFHQISDLFPCKYLGKGLHGTTVEVFYKGNKTERFAQKIVPEQNLNENFICYEPQIVDRIMLDPDLKHKIVKVHAYSINNEKRKMYLIMDLMRKSDLYFHLCRLPKKNGRFYPQKAIKRVAYELLQIVDRFHQHNLIFRNLRSENIYIKENGKLAVSDFFFAINGTRSHTYYGAAQYAPTEVYCLQKTVNTINEGALRNLNEISDATEQRQLRLSPDVRRYNLNTVQNNYFKPTRSCDLKDTLKNLKLMKKEHDSFKQKHQELNLNELKKKQSKEFQQGSKEEVALRKSSRHMTTLNFNIKDNYERNREKHHTYIIPEQPYGESSQFKQDTIRLGPGFVKLPGGEDDDSDQDSNLSQSGGRDYDKSIDTWMLGVLLYELIFGRTPFEKWKGTCDVLSKTPACPSYAENLVDLQHLVKNKQIAEIWPTNSPQNTQPIVSSLQVGFISALLTRQPEKRKTVNQLKSHPFLSDCDKNTPIEQLIYEQNFDPNTFQKDIKYSVKNKDSGLVANRTILRKTCRINARLKSRITEKLFEHQKSVVQT